MLIYGHRGAKGEAPENTLAGFMHAYRHGIRRFEMDIILSQDGVPVVIHDRSLLRTTGSDRAVSSVSALEMSTLDARQNTANWHHATGIPSLDDVVWACPDYQHLQLEVKSDERGRLNRLCNRLVEWIQRENLYDRITLTSSNTGFLRSARRLDRRVSLGYVAERRFPSPVRQARSLDCQYLCCNHRICSSGLVSDARNKGMSVSTWTVNRIHDMLMLEKMGVASVITDYPTSALIYFENRRRLGHQVESLRGPETDTDPDPSLRKSG
ncbi:glycerophosphodiester phosphodiesterase [Halovibrio salipaludis]|uniref:Glycerophosphodiester phosphodiesterase n=1 Tax=Halovibrio salipaludis TaxID=2032626 RepID=A0A2A2F9H6_9GAMM|nr:glycerophosphodiester phosphodiesterase [Halovibrio salipaludis]PAU81327.1 glycerophosphodiester phosphodiesterase [Halovibrio salipaludis]